MTVSNHLIFNSSNEITGLPKPILNEIISYSMTNNSLHDLISLSICCKALNDYCTSLLTSQNSNRIKITKAVLIQTIYENRSNLFKKILEFEEVQSSEILQECLREACINGSNKCVDSLLEHPLIENSIDHELLINIVLMYYQQNSLPKNSYISIIRSLLEHKTKQDISFLQSILDEIFPRSSYPSDMETNTLGYHPLKFNILREVLILYPKPTFIKSVSNLLATKKDYAHQRYLELIFQKQHVTATDKQTLKVLLDDGQVDSLANKGHSITLIRSRELAEIVYNHPTLSAYSTMKKCIKVGLSCLIVSLIISYSYCLLIKQCIRLFNYSPINNNLLVAKTFEKFITNTAPLLVTAFVTIRTCAEFINEYIQGLNILRNKIQQNV